LLSIDRFYIEDFTTGGDEQIALLHYSGMLLISIGVFAVAYIQLSGLKKVARADFLLRIDSRWGSHEIIQARVEIQKYYIKFRAEYKGKPYDHKLCISYIQDEIHKTCMNSEKAQEAVFLMNLLDFMETVSYFANHGKIAHKELSELAGYSVIFFYEVFEKWISIRRDKYGKKHYYREFEILAKTIERSESEQCWICRACYKK